MSDKGVATMTIEGFIDNAGINVKISPYVIKKYKTTNGKYGYNITSGGMNYKMSESTKEKIRETNVQRYGNACPSNNIKIREEIEKNNIEKYGVKSFSSTDEFKNKTKHTNLSRYGVECVF